MKKLFRNSTHTKNKSHDCFVAEIGNMGNGGKKVKMTYEAYNAVEKCNVEFFDGNQWHHIFSMLDMGVQQEASAYNIWDEAKRLKRANELFGIAETLCTKLLS